MCNQKLCSVKIRWSNPSWISLRLFFTGVHNYDDLPQGCTLKNMLVLFVPEKRQADIAILSLCFFCNNIITNMKNNQSKQVFTMTTTRKTVIWNVWTLYSSFQLNYFKAIIFLPIQCHCKWLYKSLASAGKQLISFLEEKKVKWKLNRSITVSHNELYIVYDFVIFYNPLFIVYLQSLHAKKHDKKVNLLHSPASSV